MNDLTVIIPCYNKENYLHQCIDSVLAQTYENFCIIVVDDCSSDGSFAIAKEYERTNPKVKAVKNESNSGVSATRNHGAQLSDTTFITFLDADDFYYDKGKLEREMKLHMESPNDVTFSNIIKISADGTDIVKTYRYKSYISGTALRRRNITSFKQIFCRDFIIKKTVFAQVGGYKKGCSLFEDLDLLYKLSYICNFRNTGEFGTAYRALTNGLSAKKKKVLREAEEEISLSYLKQCSKIEKTSLKLARSFITGLRVIIGHKS